MYSLYVLHMYLLCGVDIQKIPSQFAILHTYDAHQHWVGADKLTTIDGDEIDGLHPPCSHMYIV